MHKQIVSISIFILIITAGALLHLLKTSGSSVSQHTCPFCDETVINRQKFYEDRFVIVMCTHQPIVPSHFPIIPKRHVERLELLTHKELTHIHQAINKVHQASHSVFETFPYLIHQKNGRKIGQSVLHVHFHFIGKRSGDNSKTRFLAKMLWAYLRGPISPTKMQKVVEKMGPAMELTPASL
ncbi:MAG: HIT family protein [Chlamydiales bacterium]|nr:HIT family protein [Chlamydiales bacterium]